MENRIETVNIYINHCEGLSCCSKENIKEAYSSITPDKERGIWLSKEAPNGVYIYTDNGYCISPDFYGLHKHSVTPVGIALVDNNHSLLVALHGSNSNLILCNDTNTCKTSKQYDSLEKALEDWDGKDNTREIAKKESPAAKFCIEYECGPINKGSWWIPSLAELNLMYKNKPMIDACLAICGGEILQGYWHWSSTEHSKDANWVLGWDGGFMIGINQDNTQVVRPVFSFL